MSKLLILLSILIISSIFLTACSKSDTDFDLNNTLEHAPLETNSNFEIQEEETLIGSKLMLDKEGLFNAEISKNKISKKATIDFEYYINNTMEMTTFMGEDLYMTPLTVNFLCKSFPEMFFVENFENLNENMNKATGEAGNYDDENTAKLIESLNGYAVEKVGVTFIDFETNEVIASCDAISKEDIKFDVSRNYETSKSFLNTQIGVLN